MIQHPVPSGQKHFLKKKEVHKPCCRLSWKKIIHYASSSPVQSSPQPPHPSLPRSTSPGSNCPRQLEQDSEANNCRVHSSSCRCFFPACHWSICTFPGWKEKLVAHCSEGLTSHDLIGRQVLYEKYCTELWEQLL